MTRSHAFVQVAAVVSVVAVLASPGASEARPARPAPSFSRSLKATDFKTPPGLSRCESYRRHKQRDARTPLHQVDKPRKVERYGTKEQGKHDRREGIDPWHHMTPAKPGHPLGPEHAQRRYNLPHKPDVVEHITLPKGQPYRTNKVEGGEWNTREITSPRRVPRDAIKKIQPLRPPHAQRDRAA